MWSTKLTYRISDKHNVEFSIFSDPSRIYYNEGDIFATNNIARMTKRFQSGYNAGVQLYSTWTNNLFTEAGWAKSHSRLDIIPWERSEYGIPQTYNYYLGLALNPTSGFYSFNDRDLSQVYAKLQYIMKITSSNLVLQKKILFLLQSRDQQVDIIHTSLGQKQATPTTKRQNCLQLLV